MIKQQHHHPPASSDSEDLAESVELMVIKQLTVTSTGPEEHNPLSSPDDTNWKDDDHHHGDGLILHTKKKEGFQFSKIKVQLL